MRVGVMLRAACLIGLACSVARAEEPSFFAGSVQLATGFDWSEGDYGTTPDTSILYVPTTLSYRWDGFPLTPLAFDELEIAVTVPYMRVIGPAVVVDGAPVVADTPAAARTRVTSGVRDGIGDVVTRVTWSWFPGPESARPVLELGLRVKAPTASTAKGLGTGEVDTSLQFGLAKSMGNVSLFGHAGYRFLGDPPGFNLRDGAFASVGGSWRAGEHFGAGLLYDWRDASVATARDAHELVPFAWIDFPHGFRIGPYGVFGFSNGSPDVGAGLQLSVRIRVP